jgi:hypothetical protein
MKLLLRREQKSGLLGGMSFLLNVRAEITDPERTNINKYKLGKSVLYSRGEIVDPGAGLLGLASRLTFKAMNISVSVDDLTGGKRVECKDIVEMLAVEDQIKEAFRTFKLVLEAAATFGGEEIVAME